MFDKKHGLRPCAMALAVAWALGLAGCGGGGGSNVRPSSPPPATGTGDFTGGKIDVGAGDTLVWPKDIGGSIDLIKGGAGTLVLTGTDGYTGGTTINDGTLQVGNSGTTGSITGNVVDNAFLVFDRSDNVTFNGIVSGNGSLAQAGKGASILTGANTYTGGTTISSGILQLGNGGTTGSIVGNVNDNGTLAFDRSDDVSFAGKVTGTGGLTKAGNGTLTLAGTNGYSGATQVNAGSLYVDGDQSAATGTTTVANGALLGGKGILGGDVNLADGATLAPGSNGAIGTLTIDGNLRLSAGSMLDYTFGQANTVGGQFNDLINVNGDLVLDGTINVSNAQAGSFGPGLYHVFNYTGTLTNNGLALGSIPSSGVLVQTGVAQQVNLINTQGMAFAFWDGDAGPKDNNAINGGNGTWENGSSLSVHNWTDASGAVNAPFGDSSFSVFQAKPGTVTVDDGNGDINVAGMQFASNGYIVQGDAIHLVGNTDDATHSIIRVGDGTAAGAGYTATINSVLDGTSALVKTDAGTLVLGGANTYTGGTTISDGTLQVGSGGSTGSITGDVTDNSSLVFNRRNDVTFNGVVSGSGSLTLAGIGTVILTGASTYTGGTTIGNGILQIGNGGGTGSIVGDITDNGSLVFSRIDDPIFSGVVRGSGSLVQAGTGKLTLLGANTYAGGTTISAGILQLGDGIHTGSITGDVVDNASFVFNPSYNLSYKGIISGSGSFVKVGPGTLTLTGASTYTGGTTVNGGVLEIVPGAVLGTGDINVNGDWPTASPDQMLKVDSDVSVANQILMGTFGMLDNAGNLGGTLDVAVGGYGALSIVSNHDGGNIHGNQSAVAFDSGGEVDNRSGGLVEGGSFAVVMNDGGVVSNDGINSIVRSTGGMAIQITGNSGTVINTGGGTITSNLTPIWLEHGGTVTNGAGSTIEAIGARNGDCASTGICSIFVASGASVVSSSDGGLTLNNAGNIIGNVQLIPTAYNNATLSAGGSLHGDLLLGSNSGGFLTLNGDAGTAQLYSQAVTGKTTFAGLFFKKGGGTWIVDSDDLSAVAHTEITGGVLQVGNGGTEGSIGSADVQVYAGATLAFDHRDDVTFTGSIGGGDSGERRASLVQAGTGMLTLADMRAIGAGGMELAIQSGSVQLGDGQLYSDYIRNFDVSNHGALIFDFDGQAYFLSAISGTGSLTKQGPGTLILALGSSDYTGDTTVNSGTLAAMDFLRGNVVVKPGAVLAGAATDLSLVGLHNTLGSLTNAGTVVVRKGDAVVVGNYYQASTGTLAVSLGSKLSVDGAATLSGGTLEVTGADIGYVSNTHTNVLTATGGLTGTFGQLTKDTGVVFTSSTIHYDANSVWLDTTGLNVTTAAAGRGVSYTLASMGSARRVQGAFEQLDSKIAAGKLASVSSDFVHAAGQFQQAPTLQAAQASLQSLSGQLHAASAAMTFQAIDASSRALSDRFDNVLDKGTGFGMWMHNLNVGGDMARAGFNGVGFQLNGWLVGSDRQMGRSGVAGYAFGQSRGQQRLDHSYDHDNSRSTEGMLYAGWLDGNRYTQGRVGFGHFQQDVSRQVLLGYSAQGVRTQYDGSYSVAYGESGLHLGRGGSQITPFVNVQYARIDRGGFAEQGAGGFGLRGDAQTLDRWQGGLGLRAGHHWNLDGGRAVDFNARAQWQRTLASHGDVFDASFVGVQQWQPLIGIGLSRHSGLFGVALDATLSAHATLKLSYDYEMGQRDSAQMMSARLNVAF
jgi:autotransporter-associated beta strand protein